MKRNSRAGDLDDEDGAASVVVAGEGLVDVEEDTFAGAVEEQHDDGTTACYAVQDVVDIRGQL